MLLREGRYLLSANEFLECRLTVFFLGYILELIKIIHMRNSLAASAKSWDERRTLTSS
jgi:hypothetical protein